MQIHQTIYRSQSGARSFSGQGVSVYASTSLPIQYREMVLLNRHAPQLVMNGASISTRIGSASGTAGNVVSPEVDLSAYSSGSVYLDVRHFRDNVESEVTHPQLITLDGDGEQVAAIRGAVEVTLIEARAAGVLRIHFTYTASSNGTQPETFELRRTAGPTSPDDLSIEANPVLATGDYIFETEALDDTDVYEFSIYGVVADPAIEQVLATLEDVQADASGPPAPESVSYSVV